MELFTTPAAVRDWSTRARCAGSTVAFVPTMGALHAGHLALIARARRLGDVVVVSIFVNPIQFDRPDDFESYPRPLDDDLDRCRHEGVDVVYAPTAATMYPSGFQTTVAPGPLADDLEGGHRPGHFQGVTTVVTKLLAAVRPDVAVFGEKDAQQLAIVRRLVADLDLGVDVVGVATVREPDGLALSSRNARLDPESRRAARCIPAALTEARRLAAAGERVSAVLEREVADRVAAEPGAELEYARVVDRSTFAPAARVGADAVLVAAAWVGGVRLIDNVRLLDDGNDGDDGRWRVGDG